MTDASVDVALNPKSQNRNSSAFKPVKIKHQWLRGALAGKRRFNAA
jgi:hypothetical protein